MTIYLAGPWKHRDEVRAVRDQIQAAGITVHSRWIDFESDGVNENDPARLALEAQNDVADLMFAEALVVLNYPEPSEGKACETGMALILGIPVISVRAGRNVFLNLPQVRRVDTVEAAIEILAKSL
jgi:nucleoside 2-deoxyribosyltransferase